MTVISYPIPAWQNAPIQSDYYQPRQFFIDDITRGLTTTVTTTVDHDYVVGQQVRLLIPQRNRIRQLNERQAFVISIPADDQVVLDIDSRQMDAFVSTATGTQPQILAIGDISTGQQNSQGRQNQATYPLGAFINVSP